MQKILIVEDDRELNRTICYALKKEGYDIYSAYSVCEAKAIYRQEKMELILLDVNLPDGRIFSLQMDERTEGSPGFVSDSERFGGGCPGGLWFRGGRLHYKAVFYQNIKRKNPRGFKEGKDRQRKFL